MEADYPLRASQFKAPKAPLTSRNNLRPLSRQTNPPEDHTGKSGSGGRGKIPLAPMPRDAFFHGGQGGAG